MHGPVKIAIAIAAWCASHAIRVMHGILAVRNCGEARIHTKASEISYSSGFTPVNSPSVEQCQDC